ncbi:MULTISPECIES: hypothetical protein [Bacteroides]|nr:MULTISPECIES: hypothetical protein [Bacteroides]MCS3160843.1 hypothetical protein [Bacteroides faecis]MDC2215002.1 hypothetical protein [Bacteroides thetaiotaomicron]
MERMLKEKYKVGYVNGKLYHLKVNLVRYADDRTQRMREAPS